MNCGLVKFATVKLAGVTAIETNGFVMVSAALPETEPEVAVMVTLPGATPLARPPVPIEAIRLFDDCQVAVAVKSLVLASANVPMAVYCCVALGAMEAAGGVTAMETSGLVTVSTAIPEIAPNVAVIVEVAPGVFPVARPAAVIVAPAPAVQVTDEVMFFVLLSL